MSAVVCASSTGQKRVRAFVGGEVVVDSTAPLLVWESPHYPQYYLPRADVRRRPHPDRHDAPTRPAGVTPSTTP